MPLNNFRNWWYKFPQLIKFIFEYCLKVYFKFHIRLVHFFIETKVGFLFYVFCVFYGFFGHNQTPVPASNFFAALFALYILESSIELWILVKIPFSRKFLEKLLTRQYIIRYLGENIGSKIVSKAATIIVSTAAVESGTKYIEAVINKDNANAVHDTYINDMKSAGRTVDPSSKEYNKMIEEKNFHLRQPTTGIITKTINAESSKHAVSTVGSTITKVSSLWWPGRPN